MTAPTWLVDALGAARPGALVAAVEPFETRPGAAVSILFDYLDHHGDSVQGAARLYLPTSPDSRPGGKFPLVIAAGYELPPELASAHLDRGCLVATPVVDLDALPASHPLCRGPNLDIAVLHLARALSFVDDARVLLTGGSAGGYQALMLASESFPVGAVIVDAPVLDLGYTVGCFLANSPLISTKDPAHTPAPILASVVGLAQVAAAVLGPDPSDGRWLAVSPLDNLDTLTCPVSMTHSSADLLVPARQVGLQPSVVDPDLPAGFTFDPPGFDGRPTLLGKVPADRRVLTHLRPPPDAPLATADLVLGRAEATRPPTAVAIHWSDLPWSITVLDEGAPQAQGGHMTHLLSLERPWEETQSVMSRTPLLQLSSPKLMQLMRRLDGEEWIGSGLHHLDHALAERSDVLRGLRTYLTFPGGRERLTRLHAQLPARWQLLGERLQLLD